MERIRLHENGPEISRIACGMWRLGEWGLRGKALARWIEQAADLGMTAFDHADIYGDYLCESIFGEALAAAPQLRPRIQLITKCGIRLISDRDPGCSIKHYDTSRAHMMESVDRSLERLRTDFIDLLLIHRPDPLMDPCEVADAFERLRESGKVLHFGVSNFAPAQFELLQSKLPFPLVTNQIEFSVLHPDPIYDGTLDTCARYGIAPMAWSPLGGGALFVSDDGGAPRVREELEAVRSETGIPSIDILALAWLLMHPSSAVPVVGTRKLERLRAAAEAGHISLSREDWFRILRASRGADVP